ncbi:hypothetical protein BCV69DRAFT_281249 [Microstroma glucosiphilum]|uniref:Uncharacterized protein n=1 Tax=Pseudomicrostroma glucosiphilum TaxID=1684307 RepID=A0A316UCU7_9BASI|nr:hypothetical protein BCV69DRAFT_281249 [Pseudomicrostroma glucosiphilum]PWN22241.1 hypothetical protein BCV69DRAFT_281249 [Pseudomicrostroma glucosiphilum]
MAKSRRKGKKDVPGPGKSLSTASMAADKSHYWIMSLIWRLWAQYGLPLWAAMLTASPLPAPIAAEPVGSPPVPVKIPEEPPVPVKDAEEPKNKDEPKKTGERKKKDKRPHQKRLSQQRAPQHRPPQQQIITPDETRPETPPAVPKPPLALTDLPTEMIEAIVERCVATNASGILCCSKSLHSHAVVCLYKDVHIRSLDQLRSFVSARSGSRKSCDLYTRSLRIDIPGVPGSSEASTLPATGGTPHQNLHTDIDGSANFVGVPQSASAKRLLYISQALEICSKIKHLHLALFAVHHSEHRISSEYRNHESNAFVRALSGLGSLETLLWTPPAAAANIQGFSVAIVDQALQSLALGIRAAGFAAVRIRSRFQANGMKPSMELPVAHYKGDTTTANVASWSQEAITKAANGHGHPLTRVELHNAIFPTILGPANLLFTLAAPAWEAMPPGRIMPHIPTHCNMVSGQRVDHLRRSLYIPHVCEPLFPNLTAVKISSATNVSAQGVCEMLSRVGRPKPLSIEVTNGFIASIWEARLTRESIQAYHITQMKDHIQRHLSRLSRRWIPSFFDAVNPLPRLRMMQGFSARVLFGWWLTGRPSSVWPFVDVFWQVYVPLYLLISATARDTGPCFAAVTPYAQAWLEILTTPEEEECEADYLLLLQNGLDFQDIAGARFSYRLLQRNIDTRHSPLWTNSPPHLGKWRASLSRDARYRGREDTITVEEWMDDRIQALLDKRMESLKLDSQLDRIGGGHSRSDARGAGW